MPESPDPTPRPSRRQFLRHATLGAAGLAGLAPLLPVRQAFAEALHALNLPAYAGPMFTALRSEYLLDPKVTYLNHASIGTIPRPVHAAHQGYLAVCETNPWLYMWGGAWEDPREAVRGQAAQVLHCRPEEIAFLHNTTEGFNLLAHGLPLGPGDEVLFSSLNHAGASVAFRQQATRRGFTVTSFEVPLADVPAMTADDVLALYDRHLSPRTRLLVLPHVDNTVGLRHPVRALAQLARERGVAFVAVDAAQTVGMLPLNVEALGVDLFATSAHKWLQAPKGLGLAYVSPALQEVLEPMWVTWGQDRWHASARRYEDYGTRNLAGVLALGDALDFQQQLDPAAREARLRALWAHTHALTEQHPRAVWRSPVSWDLGGSLYAIEIEGRDSRELARTLFEAHGVVFRTYHTEALNTVRLSPNVFTTEDELTRFFDLAMQA